MAGLSIRKRLREGRQVFTLEGEINGSTACQALDRLGEASHMEEIVLDLSGLTIVDPFGLEVLSRGLRRLGRGRRIRIQASAQLLPILASLAGDLVSAA